MRLSVLLVLLVGCALSPSVPMPSGASPGSSGGAAAATPPNILFLFADDMRPEAIGAYDHPFVQTPHIDSLVERGTAFRSNYCFGSIHGAVCQPSRAMVMTGRSLWKVPMDMKGVTTLPMALEEHGYRTFGTGKWHNGQKSFAKSFQRGEKIMFGGMSDHTKVPVVDMNDDKSFTKKAEADEFSSELFANAAIRYLDATKDDAAPFFTYVAFTSPHDPRQPPEPYLQAAYDRKPTLPENFMPQHPFQNGRLTTRDEKLAAWPRTEEIVKDQLAEYYGMIDHLDAQIGRILEKLEETGKLENTVVVFAADHGLAVGSHGLLGKQNLYEHSMGCPLVVAGPGIPKGEVRALTYLFDLFPTLCGVAGVDVPDQVEGQDLSPLWRGEQGAVRDTLFTAYEDKIRAVRNGRYKLLRYPRVGHVQLFDLNADPNELTNLAESADHAEVLAELDAAMATWREDTADPAPLEVAETEPLEVDLTGRQRKPDRWQPKWVVEKYFR